MIISIFSLALFAGSVEAKILPQAQKSGISAPVKSGSAGISIGVYPRLRSDRRALIISFSNLQNAKSVSYSLRYDTNTQQEGAIGSVNLSTGLSSETEELLFGTCSKGVCTYHAGIKNAHLEISYTLKSGKKYIKRYKIRV